MKPLDTLLTPEFEKQITEAMATFNLTEHEAQIAKSMAAVASGIRSMHSAHQLVREIAGQTTALALADLLTAVAFALGKGEDGEWCKRLTDAAATASRLVRHRAQEMAGLIPQRAEEPDSRTTKES